MSVFFALYRQLISDSNQLAELRSAESMTDFFACLKQLWRCEPLDDEQLIQILYACNQQLHELPADQLAGNWFAASYRNRSIGWCSPCGAATEGFQDQYISRCQQQILNQLLRPRTSLESLLATSSTTPPLVPAGFVFHLSRCGSTLISGCLSELDSTNVLSEPPALTELLLDENLDSAEQMRAIAKLLQAQRQALPGREQVIIKWNAWDILRWQDIRAAYPQVPVVLLVRDPLEILASHERQAGRHMSGDPALQHVHPAFDFNIAGENLGLLSQRVQVLRALMMQMQKVAGEAGVMLVDYRELERAKMLQIARFFNLSVDDEHTAARIGARMQFHSKAPAQTFMADSSRKRAVFSSAEQAYIARELGELYQQLSRESLLAISEH